MQQAHYKMKKLIMKANNFNTTTPKKQRYKNDNSHKNKILKTTFLNHKDRKKKKPYQTAKRHAQKDERKKNNKH